MLEIGSLVDGKYKILNKVGQGGMSVVYLAMNEKANKQWAIKEVRKDGIKDFEVVKQGLVVETDMLKRLSHPSLPSIIDVIEDENTFLIVMDYIQGNPLSKTLEEYGAQPQEFVIEWAKQLCDVLGYLHTRTPAIIYRDMKPANVMLKPDGNVTLIDFGTAREYKEKNIADTTCLGTVGYAAPEQFGGMGQTDARTDIYCLGATLYHLVTGMNPCEPPYDIKPICQINPALSNGLERIIMKCTQRDPEDRYQSCAELMYALEHYEEIDDIHRKKQKRRLGGFITSLVTTIVFGAVSAWGYSSAEAKKSENYNQMLAEAEEVQDYYDTILIDPTRPDAYLELNNYFLEDFEIDKDEGSSLLKLKTGLDDKNGEGFSSNINVLEEFKESNPDEYQDVCYEIGLSFIYYYKGTVDTDKYEKAQFWLNEAKDKYEVAKIYYDISECLALIKQYEGAKILQTEKMYDQYEELWGKIEELHKSTKNFKDNDSKRQVWIEINSMINSNIKIFLDITEVKTMTDLLGEILTEAEEMDEAIVQEQIDEIITSINETINKIESAKEAK